MVKLTLGFEAEQVLVGQFLWDYSPAHSPAPSLFFSFAFLYWVPDFFYIFSLPPPWIIFVAEVRCLCWYHHTCILILIRSLFKCSFWSVLCIELIKSRYTVVLFVFVCGGNTNRKWSKDVVLVSYKLYTSVSLWRGFDCRVCPVQKWGCHFLSSFFFFLFFLRGFFFSEEVCPSQPLPPLLFFFVEHMSFS